jgi:prophage antirepressor-like protein
LWFVLADMCEVLELSHVTETAKATGRCHTAA